jgi:hypothetical protein
MECQTWRRKLKPLGKRMKNPLEEISLDSQSCPEAFGMQLCHSLKRGNEEEEKGILSRNIQTNCGEQGHRLNGKRRMRGVVE